MFSCGGRAYDSLVQQLPLMDAAALARSASTSYLLILLAAIVAELQGRLQDEASSDEWQLPDGSNGRFAGGFRNHSPSSQSLGSQQPQAPPAAPSAETPPSLPSSCRFPCEFCGNLCSRPIRGRTHRHHRCNAHRHL